MARAAAKAKHMKHLMAARAKKAAWLKKHQNGETATSDSTSTIAVPAPPASTMAVPGPPATAELQLVQTSSVSEFFNSKIDQLKEYVGIKSESKTPAKTSIL